MNTPLEDFFAQFANLGFEYRGEVTAQNNFERLQQVSHWAERSADLREARENFNNALNRQFNVTIGTGTDLASWQRLCTLIDIIPVPLDIQECQRVRDAHVNIVDLLESVRAGNPVQKFATLEELRSYTITTRRIFPKGSAYAGGLLKELLREIFGAYRGRKQNGSGRRRRRRRRARRGAAAAAA